jgi:hypothetical protein
MIKGSESKIIDAIGQKQNLEETKGDSKINDVTVNIPN